MTSIVQCSMDCGRGQRTRQALCVDVNDVPLQDTVCRHLPKPRTTDVCDMGSCAVTWFMSEWTSEVGDNLLPLSRIFHSNYMHVSSSHSSVPTHAVQVSTRVPSSALPEVVAV